ncbi:hypothetical protein G9A89_004240 [Geosiphon pyriformis]|nr:hypothetical protein G9A89_004240 [Geosiphon pyriformis]
MESLVTRLTTQLQASQLRNLVTNCGLLLTASKSQLARRLAEHFYAIYEEEKKARALTKCTSPLSTLVKDPKASLIIPESIISLDIGYKNLAYAHVTKDLRIIDWKTHDFQMDKFDHKLFGPVIREFVHTVLLPKQMHQVKVAAFVMERQAFRMFCSLPLLKVMTVETAIYMLLLDRVEKDVKIESLSPLKMARYLDSQLWGDYKESTENDQSDEEDTCKLAESNDEECSDNEFLIPPDESQNRIELNKEKDPDDFSAWLSEYGQVPTLVTMKKTKKSTGNNQRKKISKLLVKNWLRDHKDRCPECLLQCFTKAKKKDDLADALLQAFIYYNFQKTSIKQAFSWINQP